MVKSPLSGQKLEMHFAEVATPAAVSIVLSVRIYLSIYELEFVK